MTRRSRTVTLDKDAHGYDPAAHVRRILLGDMFKDTTWAKLEFKGTNQFTLIATGSKGEKLTVEIYAEASLRDRAGTASDIGGEFGRTPTKAELFAELSRHTGQRKFDVTN